MGKPTGFLEYERQDGAVVTPEQRVTDFSEFHKQLSPEQQQIQGARCMDCGVPFCQAGMQISGMTSGCPLNNLVPDINELVYKGHWKSAYNRLSLTHGLPEFTSRVCPALCENACTCGLHSDPVSTKENERMVIEYAFEHGLVKENVASVRTGKKIAVIGSGPAGLSAAQLLNRRGHSVTVFERSDCAGGLLRYGIPNMKLDKRIIDRRVRLLSDAGVEFKYNVNVGKDISAGELLESYDRVILCCGASQPRDISAPGRDAKGIYFAVDFLSEVTKKHMEFNYDSYSTIDYADYSFGSLKGKSAVVIGGGDTGNDCVGTCIRLGVTAVTQLEMMPCAPAERADSNPWPEWSKVSKTDYGQEEAIALFGTDPRMYSTTVKQFNKDKNGNIVSVTAVSLKAEKDSETGRMIMTPVEGSEKEIPADIVLIAAGFTGTEKYVVDAFEVEVDARTNVKTASGSFETSKQRVFTAGDMHIGQSLVVKAIAQGRMVASAVDESLMGYTNI